jgi:ATP/maltotriose-dependent transcriptional regulator MalT
MASQMLHRRRLINLMDAARGNTIYLFGPTGFGKSTLSRQWAELTEVPTIYFEGFPSPEHTEIVSALLKAICDEIPALSKSLRPFIDADELTQHDLDILIKVLSKEKKKFALIVENAEVIRKSHKQIWAHLVSQLPSQIQLILITESAPSASFYKAVGSRPVVAISTSELAFTIEEIQQLSRQLEINIDQRIIDGILEITRGWPLGVHIALSQAKVSQDALEFTTIQQLNVGNQLHLSAQRILSNLEESEIELLRRLSFLDKIDSNEAFSLTQESDIVSILTRLSQKTMVIEQFSFNPPVFTIHPLLKLVLRNELIASERSHSILESTCSIFIQQNRIKDLARLLNNVGSNSGHSAHLQAPGMRTALNANLMKSLLDSSVEEIDGWIELGQISTTFLPLSLSTLEFFHFLLLGKFGQLKTLLARMPEHEESVALKSIFAYTEGRLNDCFSLALETIKAQRVQKSEMNIPTIFALRLALIGSVIQDDDSKVSLISEITNDSWFKNSLQNHNELILGMRSIIAAQQGRLIEARNAMLANEVELAQSHTQFFYPFDSLLANVMVVAESGDHHKGLEILEIMRSHARDSKNYSIEISVLGRMAYLQVLLGNNVESLALVAEARELVVKNNLSRDLNDAIDIWEVRVQYWLVDHKRVEDLFSRSKTSYLMRAFKAGILINSKTPKKALEILETFDLQIPRQLLTYHLFRAHIFSDSSSAQLREVSKAVEIGSTHGYFNHFLTQRSDVIQQYISLVAQSPTTFNERLARAAGVRLDEMMVGGQEQALTRREADILRHLSTGLSIAQIALDLRISKNTMKTHLKNIYRKLEVSSRSEAVEKGKKLFKV